MNVETLRDFCLSKTGASESLPFDESTLVFKVGGKMFALLSLDEDLSMNLKCDPEKAIELREQYDAIIPGYHMNKQHWNTVIMDGSLPSKLILGLIDHSYDLIVESLPRKEKEKLKK